MLPTPSATMADRGGRGDLLPVVRGNPSPSGHFTMPTWPTPKASPSGPDFARADRRGSGGDDLATAVARWPTPTALDWKGSGVEGQPRDRLDYAVERGTTKTREYPTPTATNTKAHHMRSGGREARSYGTHGQLNPTWVEWLMGFPLGWTDLGDLETP